MEPNTHHLQNGSADGPTPVAELIAEAREIGLPAFFARHGITPAFLADLAAAMGTLPEPGGES